MLMPVFDRRRAAIDPTTLPAARLVPPPIGARRLARRLGFLFTVAMVVFVLAPWQQNVSGKGRVIAFAPEDRQQKVDAPVKGRIVQWFVREGEHIEEGDPIVEIKDNDPEYFERLRQARRSVETQLQVYEAQVAQLDGYVMALEEARDRAVEEAETEVSRAEQKVRAAMQKLTAATAARKTAAINLERVQELFEKGIQSKRKLELAELKATKTQTDLEAARADLDAARRALDGKRAALANKRAEAEAKVENARASRGKAEAAVQDAQQKLVDYDTKLARQRTQLLTSPRDAFVLRVTKAPGQVQVKPGDVLAVLVPDTSDRVAEIYVDGNDAAIIAPGRKVRLQFEGWPAVQFAGWPSVAIGTFGGEVQFVDAADSGKGDFRIIVRPDQDDIPWPDPVFLRQGTRAKAWVLLDQVTLGYELWRRFNGFPPAVEMAPTSRPGKTKIKEPGK
jgi:multidrug efflux pump subunit AcrA (membrane-fusion protein)